MAEETGKNRKTLVAQAKKASDEMVREAKERVMQELLPKAIELMQARMEWEIKELKEGRLPKDVNHADRFMKGMFLLDHMPLPEKDVPTLADSQSEEIHTLAGLVATKRITKKKDTPALPESTGEIIDVEVQEQEKQDSTEDDR